MLTFSRCIFCSMAVKQLRHTQFSKWSLWLHALLDFILCLQRHLRLPSEWLLFRTVSISVFGPRGAMLCQPWQPSSANIIAMMSWAVDYRSLIKWWGHHCCHLWTQIVILILLPGWAVLKELIYSSFQSSHVAILCQAERPWGHANGAVGFQRPLALVSSPLWWNPHSCHKALLSTELKVQKHWSIHDIETLLRKTTYYNRKFDIIDGNKWFIY